jgi:hypothetical protein
MADTLRLRGQEIQIRVIRNGRIEQTLTAIKDFTWTPKFDILREGMVGETTDRRDDIYRGVAVELTFQPESKDAWTLIQLFIDRAQRRTAQANARLDVSFVAELPNGQRPRVTIPDLKTGDTPFRVPARDQYVDIKLSLEADTCKISGV